MARLLIEAFDDYAIFRVSRQGIIESWNPGAERINGYKAAEVIGRRLDIFYSEEDRLRSQAAEDLRKAAATGRFEHEAWRLRKDGSRFRAHLLIQPILNDGKHVGFAKIVRDVSAQYDLDRAKEQLAQAQKLEIVGQMTGGLAHDFNNLLTAILGCFDLINQLTREEAITRLIDAGTTATVRGQKLVAQLLAFGRRQTLWPCPTDVNHLIDQLQPLLRQAIDERIQLTMDLDRQGCVATIDPAQLQSALLNLVVNARDAMPQGGELVIRSAKITLGSAPHVPPTAAPKLPPGPYIAITISDNGVGMTEAVRERAIEPYFTTKGIGRGSGLGLSQVYGFAVQSGGAMQLDSAETSGTVVRLFLPVEPVQGVAETPVALPARKAVLVVDDDPELLRVAVEMLKAAHYQVYTAEDAAHAIVLLQHETPIDILFTDIVMPGNMSGMDLARRAVRLRPNLCVLLTSGYPRDALRSRHGVGDEVAFLSKPYRLGALVDALSHLVGEHENKKHAGLFQITELLAPMWPHTGTVTTTRKPG
jgi:PAS domain S-box-containing protein